MTLIRILTRFLVRSERKRARAAKSGSEPSSAIVPASSLPAPPMGPDDPERGPEPGARMRWQPEPSGHPYCLYI